MIGTLLAAEGPNGKILPHDINELYWSIVAIAVVGFLLGKFAVPAIKKGLASRTAKIEQALGAADAAKAEALAQAERVRASVGDAEADSVQIVAEARRSAEQLKVSLRERADQEAADLRQRALVDIESQKAQAIADLQAEVAALARGAAEAVVRHNLDDATQASLIDNYINQVGA
ncbi:MAG: F0F1 ATP synthase subunit B [Acidimicrobiia bacterium]